MLELKDIKKTYVSGDEKVEALKGINLKFRESEFVSILGASGCGKTTLLNIIGGLDRYTSGDLIINGKSTKDFKDRDWDAYRNYKVGFVFQSYNLISHQTILSNVELALTIGGISKKERKERAIKALEEVGLKEQIHKKPNQLSGGQMQRVAIARALVNNPDIILADEPTGALDTKTSVQVMEILKKISQDKLIVMVTHNPDLAEKYSSRIIRILDGNITADSNPINEDEKFEYKQTNEIGKTKMKFWTAFRLSLNNLLTKKGRTVLVAFAGSIGIIGIALVQSVSNGFQAYVDKIQEDTLTSYPLTIMQESTDVVSALLSMATEEKEENDSNEIKEEQYISKMLDSLSTNDLKSFRDYYEEHYNEIEQDISSIDYSYSVQPMIYTVDATKKLAKINPSDLFSSFMGGTSSIMGAQASIFEQMLDDKESLNDSYDVLAGRWPENYDEMIICLSDRNSISDLLVYSLGLRNTEELTDIVTKIMSGEQVDLKNEPMSFSYEDLMNVELRLLMPTDLYKYNERYDIYEDMSKDDAYLQGLYGNAVKLKIVGIVTAKEGVTSAALEPGVSYTGKLIDYIIDYSSKSTIVKKQLESDEVDVISGKRFDAKKNELGLNFQDLVSIDSKKLQSAFNINIDQKSIEQQTAGYMTEISNAITTDIAPAKQAILSNLNDFANEMFKSINGTISISEIEEYTQNYLESAGPTNALNILEEQYVVPKDVYKTMYSGLLKALLQVYITGYVAVDPSLTTDPANPTAAVVDSMISPVITQYINSAAIQETANKMASGMTEAVMKKTVLSKVGELTGRLTQEFASAFNVDQEKIASAFQLKITEDEITRIVTAMMTDNESNAKTNLIALGYQNKEEPTYISFYFNSFDGKEHFIDFINKYNEKQEADGNEDKVINFTDTTGILMGSVKTIVNAVTYVLIAFISISLVVSSIMIGIITYISVYERTKEIGILRAIGASKHNISSIFNAETFIIGLLSGLFGIGVTYAVIPIINKVLHVFTGNIPLNATFYPQNAVILVILSVILTLIGGLIPARAASKKDPVIALRTE
ncbi:MAG: ABC transporter ATP-binding protein/permease [Clostridia bacterium]|nr:ABC transporter ATP-binding protein/permease [Clostridia bacterium]